MKRSLAVALAIGLMACTAVSTGQTASPGGAGKTRNAIAPPVSTFRPPPGGPFGGGPNPSTAVVAPNVEVAARFGLSDAADIGVKGGPTGASFDVKYAVANTPGFVASIAPGVGVLYLNSGGNPSTSQTTL